MGNAGVSDTRNHLVRSPNYDTIIHIVDYCDSMKSNVGLPSVLDRLLPRVETLPQGS